MMAKWQQTRRQTSSSPSSFYGYYTGAEHYFEHIRDNFYDFRRNNRVEYSARCGRGTGGGDTLVVTLWW